MSESLPACGLYRTTRPLAGKEEQVPAGVLIYFHNHSQQGPPLVLLPASNSNNNWKFHERGYLVESLDWVETLTKLPAQGLYVLRRHLHLGQNQLPAKSLVQLGYNRTGEPILFPGRRVDNTIDFPLRGAKFNDASIFEALAPADFVVGSVSKSAPKDEGPTLH